MKKLTIGRLAKKMQINVETIRYYERKGLIPEPPRSESGYRLYSQEAILRIQFIRNAKKLGFSLKEISKLLSLRINPDAPCIEVRKRAEVKIAEIEEKIQILRRMKEILGGLIAVCSGNGPLSKCPILEALESSPQNLLNQ